MNVPFRARKHYYPQMMCVLTHILWRNKIQAMRESNSSLAGATLPFG